MRAIFIAMFIAFLLGYATRAVFQWAYEDSQIRVIGK